MTVQFCAILILISAPQSHGVANGQVGQLYEQARRCLAESNTRAAIAPLEQIIAQSADTPLATIATLHLSECLLINSDPKRALEVLTAWKPVEAQVAVAEKISPGIESRIRALTHRAYRECALNAEVLGEFEDAIAYVRRASELDAEKADLEDLERDLLRLCVKAAKARLMQGADAESMFVLAPSHLLDSIRFALAEDLLASGQLQPALEQYTLLHERLQDLQAGEALPQADWLTTVRLRRCELLLQSKQYTAAEELIVQPLQSGDDDRIAPQLQFILARIAIAKIDFDRAIEILQNTLRENARRDKSVTAQAEWMCGEVFFLQKDFAQALPYYRRAIEADANAWTPAAMLQMAKCHELSGNQPEAVTTYKLLAKRFPDDAVNLVATARVAMLESVPTKATPAKSAVTKSAANEPVAAETP